MHGWRGVGPVQAVNRTRLIEALDTPVDLLGALTTLPRHQMGRSTPKKRRPTRSYRAGDVELSGDRRRRDKGEALCMIPG